MITILISLAVLIFVLVALYLLGILETLFFTFWYRIWCSSRSDYAKLHSYLHRFRLHRNISRPLYFDYQTEKIMMKASDRSEGRGKRIPKVRWKISIVPVPCFNVSYSSVVRVRCTYKCRIKNNRCVSTVFQLISTNS
jgi:hypothetical protein